MDARLKNLRDVSFLKVNKKKKFETTVNNNRQLALLVKSFTVAELLFKEKFNNIRKYVNNIVWQTELEAFYLFGKDDILINSLYFARSITCDLRFDWGYLNDLVELKLTYDGLSSCLFNFRDFAEQYNELGVVQNLRKLAFESLHFPESLSEKDMDELTEHGRPLWTGFFEVLAEMDLKLNLTALGLDGEFWDNTQDPTAEIVGKVVDFSKLDTLDIYYRHYIIVDSLPDLQLETHEDGVHCFLSTITKNMPLLQNLSISHDGECDPNDFDTLSRILKENLPNQLKSLRFNFFDQKFSDSEGLRKTISAYQQNLVRLDIGHQPFGVDIDLQKFDALPLLTDLQEEMYETAEILRQLMPRIFDYNQGCPYISKRCYKLIKSHKKEILKFLNSEVIFQNAAQNSPHLLEYSIRGLVINIKENSILANGEFISLSNED